MNNKDSLIKNVLDFLENNEKVVLITGTNQYEKHKTVIAILNKYRPKSKILFRTNSMANIYDEPFLGWAGCLKKKIKSGETFKIVGLVVPSGNSILSSLVLKSIITVSILVPSLNSTITTL
jgi:hypothetical protein